MRSSHPALVELSVDDDNDLSDGLTVSHAIGAAPDQIVGGVRRKAQSKDKGGSSNARKQKSADADEDSTHRSSKRGHPQGAGNYSQEDLKALLDRTQDVLPLGQCGWAEVHRRFTRWARKNGRPERALKSLETKYKQVSPDQYFAWSAELMISLLSACQNHKTHWRC